MTPEKDKTKVKVIGVLSLGLGASLLFLTFFTALFALFSRPGSNYGRPALTFLLMLTMSSSLLACGMQLARLRLYTTTDIQTMRLTWTGLLIVMVLCGAVAYWLVPPIADVALIVIIGLLAIRRAIIRLSN